MRAKLWTIFDSCHRYPEIGCHAHPSFHTLTLSIDRWAVVPVAMPDEGRTLVHQPSFTRKRLDDLFQSLHEMNLAEDIYDQERANKIGLGVSSDVFRARSRRHNKLVAVKCIRVFLLDDESFAKVRGLVLSVYRFRFILFCSLGLGARGSPMV